VLSIGAARPGFAEPLEILQAVAFVGKILSRVPNLPQTPTDLLVKVKLRRRGMGL
jgi:hypothetical protein